MDNETVTTVEQTDLPSDSDSENIEENVTDSDYPEVVTVSETYDIEVVTTADLYGMYETIHQDLTNITGLLCIVFILLFLYLIVRYINKIYHYLFH